LQLGACGLQLFSFFNFFSGQDPLANIHPQGRSRLKFGQTGGGQDTSTAVVKTLTGLVTCNYTLVRLTLSTAA